MYEIIFLIISGLLCYLGYKAVKNNPEMFSAEKMTSAFGTLGLLAIFLMCIVIASIILLRGL